MCSAMGNIKINCNIYNKKVTEADVLGLWQDEVADRQQQQQHRPEHEEGAVQVEAALCRYKG